jgi:hypothetical protein
MPETRTPELQQAVVIRVPSRKIGGVDAVIPFHGFEFIGIAILDFERDQLSLTHFGHCDIILQLAVGRLCTLTFRWHQGGRRWPLMRYLFAA